MAEPGTDPDSFPIPDSDEELLAQCRVETFLSGGKGGQHQNRTRSGVRLTHLPTGVVTLSRRDRSQHRNKALALLRLRKRLEKRNSKPPPRKRTRIPERERKRRLAEKRRRGRLKKLRGKPGVDTD
jgi:protein subunit release factor A